MFDLKLVSNYQLRQKRNQKSGTPDRNGSCIFKSLEKLNAEHDSATYHVNSKEGQSYLPNQQPRNSHRQVFSSVVYQGDTRLDTMAAPSVSGFTESA